MYFNEEGYEKLLQHILTKNDPEDLETLKDVLRSFHAYVDVVVSGEISVIMPRDEDVSTYREKISAYDGKRHNRHESAIISCKVLNRLAEAYGIDQIYSGSEKDRKQVASFCLEVDQYIFTKRRIVL